ncbi:DUF3306 domain-containing protein [Enterovibrio coralii]|uniref:DUF3306 domain-containing protein n=1 Tax=Enterovibrio coralii TaxID=294935 RepID=A0A135I7P3_9GAMM|nr:DUF3306 domain-containing protein [Enterovibrio coralii]KXF81471.1 hypothetical protein ATN88_01765 [Enterovibrio coralii]
MADKSFLSRWSKRKLESEEREQETEEFEETVTSAPEPSAEKDAECPADAPELEQPDNEEDAEPALTMEDVHKLKDGDSAAAFLAKGISAEVKKAALRKLFQGEAYHVLDGMNDYDLDYSKAKNLAPEVAETLRHWTKEKLKITKDEPEDIAVSDEVETAEESSQLTPEQAESHQEMQASEAEADQGNVTSEDEVTKSDDATQTETPEIGATKSTHEVTRDILSDELGQNVSTSHVDKNSNGS